MGIKTRIVLGTRKGLLTLSRTYSEGDTEETGFLGVPISYATTDRRSGTLWACLDTDHWGSKLQRSNDGSETWDCLGTNFPLIYSVRFDTT